MSDQCVAWVRPWRAPAAGTDAVPFTTQAHQDRYQWVALSLKQFAYERLRRAETGCAVGSETTAPIAAPALWG